MPRRPIIMALDLASRTGFAIGEVGQKHQPNSGSIRFASAGASREAAFAGAVTWFSEAIRIHEPDVLIWESPLPTSFNRGKTTANVTALLYGLPAIVGAVAYLRKVYDMRTAEVRDVRRHFIGTAHGDRAGARGDAGPKVHGSERDRRPAFFRYAQTEHDRARSGPQPQVQTLAVSLVAIVSGRVRRSTLCPLARDGPATFRADSTTTPPYRRYRLQPDIQRFHSSGCAFNRDHARNSATCGSPSNATGCRIGSGSRVTRPPATLRKNLLRNRRLSRQPILARAVVPMQRARARSVGLRPGARVAAIRPCLPARVVKRHHQRRSLVRCDASSGAASAREGIDCA